MKTVLFYILLFVIALLVLAGIVALFGWDLAKWVLIGLALLFLGHFGILVLQKGWGWVLAKYHAWVSAAKVDLSGLQSSLTNTQSILTGIASRVTALEQKVLGAPAAPVAASPAAAAPVAAAPAAQSAVQQSPNSNG